MKWYLKVFKQYADFGGRARRKEFWYFVLFNFIASVVAVMIDMATGWKPTTDSSSVLESYGPCYLTYLFAVMLPAIAVAVRRLHDLGKSGWWLFIGLIPFVGSIWLIVLCCQDSKNGGNRYGANPKSAKQYFPTLRREKSISTAFIVGVAIALTGLASNWIQHDVPLRFWLIPSFAFVLILLFGILYRPAKDSRTTANRRNIAFVLLAIATLIRVIHGTSVLIAFGNLDMPVAIVAGNIVGMLTNLALLALAVLMLLKSERKKIAYAAVSTIALIIVITTITLVKTLIFHYPGHLFATGLDIAVILLALHCMKGKAAEQEAAEEEPSQIAPEPVGSKITVSNKAAENLLLEDFEKPVDQDLLDQWKKSIAEQKSAVITVLALWGTGIVIIILMQGIVGIALLFACLISAMMISLSKKKKVKESFGKLGITDAELKQAIDACNNRIRPITETKTVSAKKIAHLKVTCPHCRQYTNIYVVEDGSSSAKVKCEHCKQIFEFGAGMMYEPVGNVTSIPQWAIVKATDKVHKAAVKCKKCGKHYTEMDLDIEKASSKRQTDDIVASLLMNAIKGEVGLTVLYKCSSCSAIACSNCATDKTGNAFGGRCPFCKTGYTIYSRIEPTKENASGS